MAGLSDEDRKLRGTIKVTLNDIIECLIAEAVKADASLNVYERNENADAALYRAACKRARCLDAATKMFEGMLPNWAKHRELIKKATRA